MILLISGLMVLRWWCADCAVQRHPHSQDPDVCSGPYDVSAHVGSACVEYRCCICLAHRGAPMRRLCGACAVGWTRLREFEGTLAATRASEPEAFVREVADGLDQSQNVENKDAADDETAALQARHTCATHPTPTSPNPKPQSQPQPQR